MITGSYKIWTSDTNGQPLDTPTSDEPNRRPNPNDERAIGIYFAVVSPPPDDQAALQAEIDNVLTIATRLYLESEGNRNLLKFRRCYSRLFGLARVGLEGDDASPKLAKIALDRVSSDLIDDEGLRIKTRNLIALAKYALAFSVPFIIGYIALTLSTSSAVNEILGKLYIDRKTMANFMLLWVGCFAGVSLSYGTRTATFSLADLTSSSSDRLLPQARLLFIGSLTMLFGLLFVNGLVEIKVGGKSVTDIAKDPGYALLLGILFGMSEGVLPAAAAKKASALGDALK